MALTQTNEEGLKVSNAGTNGQYLQKQSGNTGGLTWAAVNADVVDDTSPQLGGDLDIQAHKITTSTTDGSIKLEPNGTGVVSIEGNSAGVIQAATAGENLQLKANNASINIVGGTNAAVQILPHGTGTVDLGGTVTKLGLGSASHTIKTHDASENLILDPTPGTSGNITINADANEDITIAPNGTGDVIIDGLKYPQADGSAGQFLKTDGSAQLSWATPPAATATSGTDNFTVSDGNLIIGTAGHGIDFSAQGSASGGSASMDTEILDYYEEGTFTPKMTASVDFTMSHQEGAYVRVGNIVTVYIRVGWSSTNSATGGISLRDFPYNTKTNNGGYYQTGCFFDFWGFFPNGYSLVYGPGGNNYWYFGTTHGTAPLNCTDIGGGNGGFSISVTYLCND